MLKLYTFLVCLFIRWATRFARARGRVVHYTHGGRLYMTRYALWGHLTGDGSKKDYDRWRGAGEMSWLKHKWLCVRLWFPNLYVHQMHAPDLDPSLHDHPWPWAVSWIMLGGYIEERFVHKPLEQELRRWLGQSYKNTVAFHPRVAPGLNYLRGGTFHRVAALETYYDRSYGSASNANACSTWTLFLAGSRRSKKPWGYIVEGEGYVSHQARHAVIEGKEVREPAR